MSSFRISFPSRTSPISQRDHPILSLYTWLGAAIGLLFILLLSAAAALRLPWLPAAAAVAALIVVWCTARPVRWAYVLILLMFLESSSFSLLVGPIRIRPIQIALIPALGITALLVIGGSLQLKRIPLMAPLMLYIGCNLVSTFLSPVPRQSIKIMVLLLSLVILYSVVYTLARNDPKAWPTVFRLFAIAGLLEIGFGLYQVLAGACNAVLGLSLPIGDLGLFHAGYIGLDFGRPYGSLPEADTYGAVCMFYALMFGLLWLTPALDRAFSRRLTRYVSAAAFAGLILSFVRASWLGFLVGAAWAVQLRFSGRLKPFLTLRAVGAAAAMAGCLMAGLAVSPQLRGALLRRVSFSQDSIESSVSTQNARFQQMLVSYRLFRGRPLIGNGPGSFTASGVTGAHEQYYYETGADLSRIYDPSILTTVLNDTGLLGVAAFLVLVLAYFDFVRRSFRRAKEQRVRNAAASAHCALLGLFSSFVLTQYFWMPFTWVFLAIVVLIQDPEFQAEAGLATEPPPS